MLALNRRRFLAESQNLSEFRDRLLRVLSDFGFSSFAYVPIDPPYGMKFRWVIPENASPDQGFPEFVSTFPKAWVDHYLTHDYSNVDPTLTHAAVTLFPFRWAELFDKPWFTRQHRRFFSEASDFGVSNGVTVPLHGPLSGLATLNMSSELRPLEVERLWEGHQLELTRIALVTHEMMLRFLSAHPAEEEGRKLTPRERECLLWTSRGKTNWEVGEILSISPETVRFHLKNAMSKLGVYSQHHAAVAAVVRSLIFP
ncbi:MAG: LuxR family transcriptional regulator [Kiloniellales bacterium]